MHIARRAALARMSAMFAAGLQGAQVRNPPASAAAQREPALHQGVRKIAAEEAFCTPEVAAALRDVLRQGGTNLDLPLLTLIFGAPASVAPAPSASGASTSNRDQQARELLTRLLDIGAARLGAVWGYGVEASTHVVRLMFGGVFDRFPRLRLVIGHMGEALPFWLSRLDFMGAPGARGAARKNALKPSGYFRRNIAITTSGVEDPLALRYCIDEIGVENIMWAIDHPFQPTGPAVAFIETSP